MRRLLTQQRRLVALSMCLMWLEIALQRLLKPQLRHQICRLRRAACRLGRAGRQGRAQILLQHRMWRQLWRLTATA